jgi:hypothetical protein
LNFLQNFLYFKVKDVTTRRFLFCHPEPFFSCHPKPFLHCHPEPRSGRQDLMLQVQSVLLMMELKRKRIIAKNDLYTRSLSLGVQDDKSAVIARRTKSAPSSSFY